MKVRYSLLLMFVLVACAGGCVFRRAAATKPASEKSSSTAAISGSETNQVPTVAAQRKAVTDGKLIVTPENLLVGTVTTYNSAGRFVVLDFPVGRMPALDQVFFVYRQGLKIGEVKIAGPERDHMTVADLVTGEARRGDEVRDK